MCVSADPVFALLFDAAVLELSKVEVVFPVLGGIKLVNPPINEKSEKVVTLTSGIHRVGDWFGKL